MNPTASQRNHAGTGRTTDLRPTDGRQVRGSGVPEIVVGCGLRIRSACLPVRNSVRSCTYILLSSFIQDRPIFSSVTYHTMTLPCLCIVGSSFLKRPQKNRIYTQNNKKKRNSRFCHVGCDWVLVVQAPHSIGLFVGLAYQGKDIICVQIHYRIQQLKGFWPLGNNNNNNNRSIFI